MLPKGIGDVVYGLALVRALEAEHPALEISWAVHPVAWPLLRRAAGVHSAIPYNTRIESLYQLYKNLRGRHFDVVLNLGMYLHALPPTLLAGAARTLCFDEGYARDGLQWFHGETIPVAKGLRVLDAYFTAGRYLGLAPSSPSWQWTLDEAERTLREEFFAGAGVRPRVAILPCAGRLEKDWPSERWSELATRLSVRTNAFVVVTGGPSDQEARAAASIARHHPDVRVAVGNDLRRVLWILSGCDLVVGPDTGPLHLARALEVPLVGLYGHTDPDRYGPYPPCTGTLIDRYHFDAPGQPPSWEGTGGRSGRMRLITVDEVEAACLEMLALKSSGVRREASIA